MGMLITVITVNWNAICNSASRNKNIQIRMVHNKQKIYVRPTGKTPILAKHRRFEITHSGEDMVPPNSTVDHCIIFAK